MKTNAAGVALIKAKESLELSAYPDPASPLGKACTAKKLLMRSYKKVTDWEKLSGAPWTIGYGATGPDVVEGLTITLQEAEMRLSMHLNGFEADVTRLVKVPLNSNQFSALVSFVYNLGAGNLSTSTLLKKLNKSDYLGAAAEFQVWANVKDKKTGVVTPVRGLKIRRDAEAALFLTADEGSANV